MAVAESTLIVAALGLGWLVSRVVLQRNLRQRHSAWLKQRSERRQDILASTTRQLISREVAEVPGLDLAYYASTGSELEALDFRRLGGFEDETFTAAFPYLRTVCVVYVDVSDRATVALVGYLKDRRAWRRMILKFRGVPVEHRTIELTTSWEDGSFVKSQVIEGERQRGDGGLAEPELREVILSKGAKGIYVRHTNRAGIQGFVEAHRSHAKALGKDRNALLVKIDSLEEYLARASGS